MAIALGSVSHGWRNECKIKSAPPGTYSLMSMLWSIFDVAVVNSRCYVLSVLTWIWIHRQQVSSCFSLAGRAQFLTWMKMYLE